MWRKALAVVAGYVVMAVFIMVTLTIAWSVLGPSFAFAEGTTEVTTGWMAVNLPLSFLGAALGGWAAALIGRGPGAVKILAGLIFILGLGMAVAHVMVDPRPEDREAAAAEHQPAAEMSGYEASSEAIQPTWYNFALPLIGVAGVFFGGGLRGGGDRPED